MHVGVGRFLTDEMLVLPKKTKSHSIRITFLIPKLFFFSKSVHARLAGNFWLIYLKVLRAQDIV